MQPINTLILLILGLSPSIYIPLIVAREKRHQKRSIWMVITFLLGLIQCMGYLIILFALDLSL